MFVCFIIVVILWTWVPLNWLVAYGGGGLEYCSSYLPVCMPAGSQEGCGLTSCLLWASMAATGLKGNTVWLLYYLPTPYGYCLLTRRHALASWFSIVFLRLSSEFMTSLLSSWMCTETWKCLNRLIVECVPTRFHFSILLSLIACY